MFKEYKMKNLLKKLFNGESEFTKKWIARFTKVIFALLLFYLILSQELLFFHLTKGLSKSICQIFFSQYSAVVKVAITGYAVTFIGAMAKAFMAKQQEESNKLKLKLSSIEEDDEDDN